MGKFLLILGRGVGQVMFQNNALSGALMLVGILFEFMANGFVGRCR